MEQQQAHRPNLVYVFADQLRYQSVGYAGDAKARTPNIDRLAAEGVNFSNAVSGHPLCAPYRASLFTGKYSSSTGMVINELRINPNQECFAHVLTRAGYQTFYIGKWHLWANHLGDHLNPENSFVPPGPYRLGFDGFFAGYNFHHTYYNTYYHLDTSEKIYYEGYEPDCQTDMAIQCMEKAAGRPFALFLSYGTPHDPWTVDNVPAQFLDLFRDVEFTLPPNYKPDDDPYGDAWSRMSPEERQALPQWMAVYYAMVANLDWNVGRLLAALDRLGLSNDTIFVFTSDHGEMFGAQGRRAKNIFYEEAVRVPFVLRWPGMVPAGHTSDVCLNTPDIMPTLLGLMGMPIPKTVEGSNLSTFASGKSAPEPEAAFMQGMGCTAVWEDGHEWRALRSNRYTYAVHRPDRHELLFDNQADPYQLHNLVSTPQYASLLEHFRSLLRQRMQELGDTFETCTWYERHWTEDRIILRTATM